MTHTTLPRESFGEQLQDAATRLVEKTRARGDALITLLIFFLNVGMVYPVFLPSLDEIGVWDESSYINRGRELLAGTLPRMSQNPAVALLHALTYLPYTSSPYWLVYSCSLSRFVLFGLMWLASFLVASEIREMRTPLIMIGLVAVSSIFVLLLTNPSDALFAAMSAFALWQFLCFRRERRMKHLWLCSTFIGLAALSRNEGPLLLVTFVALSLVLFGPAPLTRKGVLLHALAAILPFIALVGGYIAIYAMQTGSFNLGMAQRSYTAFEQGHGIAFAGSYGSLNPFVEGQNDARRLFGTPEQNNYSILTAIRRNPSAYARRIPRMSASAIKGLLYAYNWHFAVLCFAFAARGILALLLHRSYALLATLLLWPAYSVLYILLIYTETHLLIPFATVFALAGIGVAAVVTNLDSRRERYVWSISLAALTALGAAAYRQPNDLLLAPMLVLSGLWLMWLVAAQMDPHWRQTPVVACLVLLAVALVLRLGVVHAAPRVVGSSADEQATKYLEDHFPPGTRIGAYGPGKIWAAKMTPVTMLNLDGVTTAEALWEWMAKERVDAIYVDRLLRTFEPVVSRTIGSEIDHGLDVTFERASDTSTDSPAVQIVVRTSDQTP
jgi:hypothetical protein